MTNVPLIIVTENISVKQLYLNDPHSFSITVRKSTFETITIFNAIIITEPVFYRARTTLKAFADSKLSV